MRKYKHILTEWVQKIPHVAGFLEDPFSDKWYEDYTALELPVNSVIMDQMSANLRSRPLIFLDLETTGLKVQEHEILEIGAVKVSSTKPFTILEEFEIRVKPKHLDKADRKSLQVVEYSDLAWSDAKPLDQALKLLDEFSDGGVLVGFNINFDWAVLERAYHFMGREDPFYYQRIDVMSMAYAKLFTKHSVKRFSMAELCSYLGIKQKEAHHALADAKTTLLVFGKLMKNN